MIRAVIDTNVLVSAFRTHNPDSPTVCVFYAMLRGEFLALHSPGILAEYEDVLHRDKFSFDRDRVDEIIDFIRTHGENISPVESAEFFPDPDDKIFYCTALAARDDEAFLVTGNVRHFPASDFILTPSEFAALLENA